MSNTVNWSCIASQYYSVICCAGQSRLNKEHLLEALIGPLISMDNIWFVQSYIFVVFFCFIYSSYLLKVSLFSSSGTLSKYARHCLMLWKRPTSLLSSLLLIDSFLFVLLLTMSYIFQRKALRSLNGNQHCLSGVQNKHTHI